MGIKLPKDIKITLSIQWQMRAQKVWRVAEVSHRLLTFSVHNFFENLNHQGRAFVRQESNLYKVMLSSQKRDPEAEEEKFTRILYFYLMQSSFLYKGKVTWANECSISLILRCTCIGYRHPTPLALHFKEDLVKKIRFLGNNLFLTTQLL